MPISALMKSGRRCFYAHNRQLYELKSAHMLQIKSSLYSRYYAEACNEWRDPSPRRSAWAPQLRRNVAAVASRWRHCADLIGPGIEPQTFRTESVGLATELTAGVLICLCSLKCFLEQSSIIILLVHSLLAF